MSWFTSTPSRMPPGVPGGARCVQKFDDSLGSAIRITYRISLRSSSLWEPRHPPVRVVCSFLLFSSDNNRFEKSACAGTPDTIGV